MDVWGMGGRRKVHLLRKMQFIISTSKYKVQYDTHIYTRGVSHAVRPLSVVHCVATGRIAQNRRTLLMARETVFHFLLLCLHPRALKVLYPRLTRFIGLSFCALIAVALFFGVTLFFWPTLFAYWPVLCALALFCVATTVAIMWAILRDGHALSLRIVAAPRTSYVPVSSMDVAHPFSALPYAQFSPVPPEVNTPMPVPPTPLVRVLETIDLSSTNVEHFLDIKPTTGPDSALKSRDQSTPWPGRDHSS
jgi:hypothetical protein